jgi:GT2 family glycosyltransferase
MDADGSHQPEQLPALLSALQDADLVLGSRWVKGGSVSDWPAARMALSRGGNTYVRVSLGLGLRDATGGFRAFRREVLESIDLQTVASHGYCFQVDLAWRAVRQGANVVEVPIAFVERVHGSSKMSGAIVREALWRVTQWAVSLRWQQTRALLGADRRGR